MHYWISEAELGTYVISPERLPAGFDTLTSYLAKERPDIMDGLSRAGSPVEGLEEENASLLRVCSREGLPVHYVDACPAYRRAGYARQPAYQVGLILGMVATLFGLESCLFGPIPAGTMSGAHGHGASQACPSRA